MRITSPRDRRSHALHVGAPPAAVAVVGGALPGGPRRRGDAGGDRGGHGGERPGGARVARGRGHVDIGRFPHTPMSTAKVKPRRVRLSSVANAIRLTKVFSENEYEMGISALAQRLGLAKSTVHRLATTLVEYDFLEQNRDTGKYRPGLALFELGTLVRRKMDVM